MTIGDGSLAAAGVLGIGERLRNAREARRLTLDAVAAQTRIRAGYLQALEDEEFWKLPAPIYAKGFLRAYASALGLDADELVAVYPEAFDAPHAPLVSVTAEIPIRPTEPPSRGRRVLIYGLAAVATAAIALGIIGYQGWRAFNAPTPVARKAPSAAPFRDAPAPRAAKPAPAAAPTAPVTPAATPVPQAGTVSVALRAFGTTWVRVTTGGRLLFEGILQAGDARTWSAPDVTLRLGNAPVAAVEVDGRRIVTPVGLRVWQQTFRARP